ncbi:MAG: tetratricopeptide repeat protein [Bacteroidales bacterium]|jgi:tetratricopeptide (TPR) repeat protein|nr:tetratricopeptide repeat protein [Bacteroidales bacterium]
MRGIKSIIFILAAVMTLMSCSKKLIPGLKAGKEYDQAAFDYLFVEAVRHKLMGNGGDALKFFEQSLVLNPESDAAYYHMAQIVLSTGDFNTGKRYALKACELQPGNLWYNMMMAGIYHQQNNIDSAILCYERAVKGSPEKVDLQVTLAKLYSQNRNFDKARILLTTIDERFGVNESTTLSLIDNLVAEGNYADAHAKIAQLLETDPDNIVFNGYRAGIFRQEGLPEKAREVYNKLIERNPGNPAIQLSLCEFMLEQKNFDELFDLISIVLLNGQINKEEKVSLIAELIGNEDILKDHGKKMEISVMILESSYPDDDLVILLRPEFLQKAGNNEGAAARLEEIIKANPDNYYAWEKLLLVYYDLKDYRMLQKRGEECATRFNRSVIAKMLFATGALENEDFDVALEELRKADILAGDNRELKLQILTMRADVHYRSRNYDEAFSTYEEALKMDDSDLTLMNNYAYYLAEQNMNLKEAEEMAKTVISKETGNNTFLDTYAWVLYKRGKAREASRIMEKIINSGEAEDAEYYEHYGYILKSMKKCREAVVNFEKAVSLDETKLNLKEEIENCKR